MALKDQGSYEFYSGASTGGKPTWTKSTAVGDRMPVFEDKNGVGWNLSVNYNAGLERYILVTEHGIYIYLH